MIGGLYLELVKRFSRAGISTFSDAFTFILLIVMLLESLPDYLVKSYGEGIVSMKKSTKTLFNIIAVSIILAILIFRDNKRKFSYDISIIEKDDRCSCCGCHE